MGSKCPCQGIGLNVAFSLQVVCFTSEYIQYSKRTWVHACMFDQTALTRAQADEKNTEKHQLGCKENTSKGEMIV